MFENVAAFADGAAWICPTRVEVCRPIGVAVGRIRANRYTTNYGGPLRKTSLLGKGIVSGGSSMQLAATVLTDVCYRLHGVVLGAHQPGRINSRHHLKALFDRRLKRGQCFRPPRLGWSEFLCSYWGEFRDGVTEVDDALELDIPSMLLAVWDSPVNGQYAPVFVQDVRVLGGVLDYPVIPAWLGSPDRPEHRDAQ